MRKKQGLIYMSKISVYMLIIGLLAGITGITFFFYGMNSDQSEIPVASMTDSSTDDAKEAVKVRGDWELTVSNPDGSDPTVHNFRNKIQVTAFDLLSRSLLPTEHENSSEVKRWDIHLLDGTHTNGYLSGYEICRMSTNPTGPNLELFENSVLVAKLIETDNIWLTNGLRLTGSCMAKKNVDFDDDDVIDINYVNAYASSPNFGTLPQNVTKVVKFAQKSFGGAAGEIEAGGENEEDAIVIGSPGQMISVTVDFTFE